MFNKLDEQLSCHGLETEETIRLRDEIKKFLESHRSAISQELGTTNFCVMVGGSLQIGTADKYSDIDLTIIFDRGNIGEIWTKGGAGETNEGIRGIFLFRQDSLKQRLRRDVDINLLSLEKSLAELENLGSSESEEELITLIDYIVRIFSPQLYQVGTIDDFRKRIIIKLTSVSGGKKFWDYKIAPQLRSDLIERAGDEKGSGWPEREERDLTGSQKKNNLTKRIANELKKIEIPNFQNMRMLYDV